MVAEVWLADPPSATPVPLAGRALTGSLNVAVKCTGNVFVGSAWAGAVDLCSTVTDGAVVSMTRFLLALREPVPPGMGRVRVAGLVAASLMVPPLSPREVVAT